MLLEACCARPFLVRTEFVANTGVSVVGGAETDATASELGFTGALKLSEGVLHLGSRDYWTVIGRFLQPDDVDPRRYTYASGDPSNRIDPSGHQDCEASLCVSAPAPGDSGGGTYDPGWDTGGWDFGGPWVGPGAVFGPMRSRAGAGSRPATAGPVISSPIGPATGYSEAVPVYGSGRNAINDFQTGHPFKGTWNAAMAVSDVWFIKGMAVGALKLAGITALRIATKETITLAGREGLKQTAAAIARDAALRAEAERLVARVAELNAALDTVAQQKRTVGMLSTLEGVDIAASGTRDLEPLQRALLQSGEVSASLAEAHMEMTALDAAVRMGVTPNVLVSTVKICPICRLMIEESGGVLPTKYTAFWP